VLELPSQAPRGYELVERVGTGQKRALRRSCECRRPRRHAAVREIVELRRPAERDRAVVERAELRQRSAAESRVLPEDSDVGYFATPCSARA
jgi:hypothetical protein